MSVHRFLVTAADEPRIDMWRVTGPFANWLEGRENPVGGETWLVTVFGEHEQQFLEAARAVGVTVEEIQGGGDTERYELRIGDASAGWARVVGQ